MGKAHHGFPRPRLTNLRLGEITVAMTVAMVAGLATGLAVIAIDKTWLWPPPIELGTVDGARVVMGSVTGGLITVAVFGLWMRTVVVGLMASHFSPRTLLMFLDDRFQRNLLASMSAGLVAVVVILLRMPTGDEAAVPLVSTVLVVMIALGAIAGVLLAIQHANRSLSLPELINRLAEEALDVLDHYPKARIELDRVPPPPTAPRTVRAPGSGWITGVDIDQIREALPKDGVAHLCCRVGEFVTPRRPVARVSNIGDGQETDFDAVSKAFKLARTRSPDMDLAFSVSQLVDVGTFALQSRGDTSTAHEVMVHLEAVLEEVVAQGLAKQHDKDDQGRWVYDEVGLAAVDLVQLCVERLREPAASDPEAARHLMHMLRRVREVAEHYEALDTIAEVEVQVKLMRGLARDHGMLSRDRERLEREADVLIDSDSSSRTGHP